MPSARRRPDLNRQRNRFQLCQWRIESDRCHGCDETISTSGQGFHKTWLRDRIVEHLANLIDSRTKTMIEINKSVRRPKLLANLFTCDQLAGPLQKHDEQLKRL